MSDMMKQKPAHVLRHTINLANAHLGAEVLYATDDFFAPKERLLNPAEPVFIADKYDENGKWMDGWESRRRRTAGHDHCIIKLGLPGHISTVNLNTRHFTGNYPPAASIDACYSASPPNEHSTWTTLLACTKLTGDADNIFDIHNRDIWNYLRLNIYPDGGIARLRVYGHVYRDWARVSAHELLDLAAVENGGRALACNDEHFGAMMNIIMPGKGRNMGDGWETRRRRRPGHDWVILKLGHVGTIKKISVDTAFFKGNYPERISLEAAHSNTDNDAALSSPGLKWQCLLTEQYLSADNEHHFEQEIYQIGPVSHVRINIHPDGGLSRVRLLGYVHRT